MMMRYKNLLFTYFKLFWSPLVAAGTFWRAMSRPHYHCQFSTAIRKPRFLGIQFTELLDSSQRIGVHTLDSCIVVPEVILSSLVYYFKPFNHLPQ